MNDLSCTSIELSLGELEVADVSCICRLVVVVNNHLMSFVDDQSALSLCQNLGNVFTVSCRTSNCKIGFLFLLSFHRVLRSLFIDKANFMFHFLAVGCSSL